MSHTLPRHKQLTPAVISTTRTTIGWTKRRFAQHLGVSHDVVWRWEKGDAFPQSQRVREQLYQLAKVLDLVS